MNLIHSYSGSAWRRALKNLTFELPLMFLRLGPNMEAAPHFVYLIRHNPLNRNNSFLLSVFLPRTKLRLYEMPHDL